MSRLNKRITITILTVLLIFTMISVASATKSVEYPFGFIHGMDQDAALTNLKAIGAKVTAKSNSVINAIYNRGYDGLNIQKISLHFFENRLSRVTLDSDGISDANEHLARLESVSEHLKSEYGVYRISNSIPVNSETDLKKRHLCRFQDSRYEILIYSYYANNRYYMSLNFVRIFSR